MERRITCLFVYFVEKTHVVIMNNMLKIPTDNHICFRNSSNCHVVRVVNLGFTRQYHLQDTGRASILNFRLHLQVRKHFSVNLQLPFEQPQVHASIHQPRHLKLGGNLTCFGHFKQFNTFMIKLFIKTATNNRCININSHFPVAKFNSSSTQNKPGPTSHCPAAKKSRRKFRRFHKHPMAQCSLFR